MDRSFPVLRGGLAAVVGIVIGGWCCQPAGAAVVINELMAVNNTTLADEDGDFPDWIELHNNGAATVNLIGWSLSDDPNTPQFWTFSDIDLGPNGFLVVFASDKDRATTDGQPLHTNFRLASGGEYLALHPPDPDDGPTSEFIPTYPAQSPDISYGLNPLTFSFEFFTMPTPGSANTEPGVLGIVEPPVFSEPRGCYTGPVKLEFTIATPDADIRYTLDGREPSEADLLYSDSLILAGHSVVRARGFKPFYEPSTTETNTYLIDLNPALKQLPILSISASEVNNLFEPDGIMAIVGGHYPPDKGWQPLNPGDYNNPIQRGLAWERRTSLEILEPDTSTFQVDCGIRVHGSDNTRSRYQRGLDWNQGYPFKFSFRLFFRSEYGAGKLKYPIFGPTLQNEFDQVVLRGGKNDSVNPFIRDELIRQLLIDTGHPGSRGTFANLFINGEYMGYYNPVERLDLDFFQTRFNSVEEWDIISGFVQVTAGDLNTWLSLKNYISTQDLSNPVHYQYVAERLDLVNLIDYLLVNNYAATHDWPYNNIILYRERVPGVPFRFTTWDGELSFQPQDVDFDHYALFRSTPQNSIPTVYLNLHDSPEFRLLFADRIQRQFFNGGTLTDEHILQRYEELADRMAGVIDNPDTSIRDGWIPQRRTFLFQHFAQEDLLADLAVPFFHPHGGILDSGSIQIEHQNFAGTIYLTTDNSDPRNAATDLPAAGAQVYNTPLSLNEYTILKTRVFDGVFWSALTEAEYCTADASEVVITEIFADADGLDDHREWFEVYNRSNRSININGWSIRGNDGNHHLINNGVPLWLQPFSHAVLSASADENLNGGVSPFYVYGDDIVLGNGNDEILLLQGEFIVDSVGYGAFQRTPREIHVNITPEPVNGVAIGLTGNYRFGLASGWELQSSPFGPFGDFGTPGRANDGADLSNAVKPDTWAKYI
jgi:hypothetical protein